MTHHLHDESSEPEMSISSPQQPVQKQGTISFSLSAKSLFFAGFVLGLLVMAVPATYFATRGGGGALTGSVPANQVAGTVTAPTQNQPDTTQPAGKVKPVSKDDYIYGKADAPIMLIEYSDYECPFCKRFHYDAKKLVDEYKGKVAWVYRQFPLSFHPNAQKESEAAECAGSIGGNDKFWAYGDKIFERTTSTGTGFALDQLVPLAKEIGLDEKKFKDCLDGGKMAQKVQQSLADGQAAGIDGTPGNIFVTKNGKPVLIPGAVPYETLKSQVDQLLAQNK